MAKSNYLTGFKPPIIAKKSFVEQTKNMVLARTRTFNFYIELLHKQLLRKKTAEGFFRASVEREFKNTPYGDVYIRTVANIKSPDGSPYNKNSDSALGLNQFFMGQNPKSRYIGDLKDGIYHDECVLVKQRKPIKGAISFIMAEKSTPNGVRILYAHPNKRGPNVSRYALLRSEQKTKSSFVVPELVLSGGELFNSGKNKVKQIDSYVLTYDIYENGELVATEMVQNCVKKEYEIPSITSGGVQSFKTGIINYYIIKGFEPKSSVKVGETELLDEISVIFDCASAYKIASDGSAQAVKKENFYSLKKGGWTSIIDGKPLFMPGEYISLNEPVFYKSPVINPIMPLHSLSDFRLGDMVGEPLYFSKNNRPVMVAWQWFERYMEFYHLHILEKDHIPSWVYPVAMVAAVAAIMYGGYQVALAIGKVSAGAATIGQIGVNLGIIGAGVSVMGFAVKSSDLMKIGQIIGIAGAVISAGSSLYLNLFEAGASSSASALSTANASAQNGLSFNHFFNPAAPVGSGSGVAASSFGAGGVAGFSASGGVDFSVIMGSNSFNFAAASGLYTSNAGALTGAINAALNAAKIYNGITQMSELFRKAGEGGDFEIPQEEQKTPKYQRGSGDAMRRFYHLNEVDLGTEDGTILFISQKLKKDLMVEAAAIDGDFAPTPSPLKVRVAKMPLKIAATKHFKKRFRLKKS